jgi:predicted ATPase
VLAADSLAQPQLADGVWFIALAAVVDQAMVIPAIVDALGAAELPGASSLAILCAHLRDRRLLLVLDNFEHVVGAAPALSELLMACPGVRALVTSRAALRILGEQEWPVPPLALPDPTQVPSADQLGHYEAIALFVDRAQAIRPTFDLTLENAPAVAEICRRLDGLPLAIELAAARVRVLTAPQIAARLDGNLRLIESEEVGAQPRQRTLRAAMDWSYGLLAPDERTLLGRLAVFAGGWTLEAADEVCDGDALELTTALVDHSLVDVEMGEPPRYRLLEMVRQYAEAKLELAGDVASIRDRHLRWCLALCDRTRPQDADPARVAEVARELPNLRAALRWAVASDQVEVGFRIVNGLSGFWYARGQYAEGREWVAALLAAPGGRSCTAARASALRTAGHLALQQCDFAAAERYQEEAAAIAAELGDQEGLASTMQMRARLAAARGDLPTAERLFREVVATEERLGRPTWLLFGLVGLADAVTELGDAPDQASRLAERALTLARELRSQQGQAMALRSLGRAAARTRDLEAARSWLHQALEVERALNNRRATAQLLVDLADLAAATPDQEEARRLYKEGVRTAAEVRSWPEIGYCLEGLAALLADAEPRRAIVLAIAADDLLTRTGVPLSTERSTRRAVWSAAARRRVGDDSFRAAEQDGLALTLDGMLELAVVR